MMYAPAGAHALVITEIMYDAPGADGPGEWIEIYNTGATAVDISTYTFTEGGVNHGISPTQSPMLPAGAYGIIANDATSVGSQFSITHLFDSSFSLSNQGEALALKQGDTTVFTATYAPQEGANGTGNTLHYTSGTWSVGSASPGNGSTAPAESAPTTTPDTESSGSTDSGTTQSSSSSSSSAPRVIEYKATITAPKEAQANTPVPILFEATKYINSSRRSMSEKGAHFVHFGDGKTVQASGAQKHTYRNPGTYTIYYGFSHTEGFDAENPTAEATSTITIVKQLVSLDINQQGTIITNKSKSTLSLTDWHITQIDKGYTIPPKTRIASGASIILDHAHTGLAPEKRTILFNTQRSVVATHVPDAPISPPTSSVKKSVSRTYSAPATAPAYAQETPPIARTQSRISASAPIDTNKKPPARNSYPIIWWLLVGGGILVTIGSIGLRAHDTEEGFSAETEPDPF